MSFSISGIGDRAGILTVLTEAINFGLFSNYLVLFLISGWIEDVFFSTVLGGGTKATCFSPPWGIIFIHVLGIL